MALVVLKTDALFFLLLAVAGAYTFYARRREHLAAPWRQVLRRPLGMSAAVVLMVYVVVAVLDSIHFQPQLEDPTGEIQHSTEIISTFDVVVAPLKGHVEKTYSAPFATHAFARETIELADGGTTRDYPRLQYGGAHLEDPAASALDIASRTAWGVFFGLLAALGAALVIAGVTARKHNEPFRKAMLRLIHGRTRLPWRPMLASLTAVTVLIGFCCTVGPYYHILGTDKVGTDVLYQGLKSIRTGLLIGTLTTLVMLPFALVLGIMAGYFRGWIDDAIQYLYTTLSSIPGVLLIAAAALMLEVYMAKHTTDYSSLAARADLRLLALCMILGVTTWTGLCRYLRGEALKLREVDFILAARAFGVPSAVIVARHILPNVMHIIMISIVLDFSMLVLAEAALSYINIGVDPSMESWGNMINSARLELAREPVVWWSLIAALVFMFVLVLAANVFADTVRDAFDPRLRDGQE